MLSADRCPAGRAPSDPQVGPNGLPGGALGGSENVVKPMDFQRFVVWQQVKVAPSNKTNKKSNKKALKCSWSFGAPPEEPREAPQWGPRASQEEPCGVQKWLKNHKLFNDSWFGSKSRWHHATRATRRATRGPKGPMPRFGPRTLGHLWPQEAPKWGPRASREDPCGAQKRLKTCAFSMIPGLATCQGGTKQQDQQEQ